MSVMEEQILTFEVVPETPEGGSKRRRSGRRATVGHTSKTNRI